MSFWKCWFGGASNNDGPACPIEETLINPSAGLPMQGGIDGVDMGGSPYGLDIHQTPNPVDSCSSLWMGPGDGSMW